MIWIDYNFINNFMNKRGLFLLKIYKNNAALEATQIFKNTSYDNAFVNN